MTVRLITLIPVEILLLKRTTHRGSERRHLTGASHPHSHSLQVNPETDEWVTIGSGLIAYVAFFKPASEDTVAKMSECSRASASRDVIILAAVKLAFAQLFHFG